MPAHFALFLLSGLFLVAFIRWEFDVVVFSLTERCPQDCVRSAVAPATREWDARDSTQGAPGRAGRTDSRIARYTQSLRSGAGNASVDGLDHSVRDYVPEQLLQRRKLGSLPLLESSVVVCSL